MPGWNEVLIEMQASKRTDALDVVRRKYLKKLANLTKRNVIAYYSGWLQRPGLSMASINDGDKNGLMATIHKLDRSKGLDLILHTPGGDTPATESIVHYLREMFGTNVRAIIPQMAMSSGTMIACSCKEIIMGKQSNIGPIDPQLGGYPAYGILSEFQKALRETKEDPATIPIWQVIVGKYHPTSIGECSNAINLASELVTRWLKTGMFKDDDHKDEKVEKIVTYLNSHKETKTHYRHIHTRKAMELGLTIKTIEDDFVPAFQDTVMTVHHAYMHTFSHSPSIKIIENQHGNGIALHAPENK